MKLWLYITQLIVLASVFLSLNGLASAAYECPDGMDSTTCGICTTNPSGPGCDGTDKGPTAQSIADGIVGTIIDIFSWVVGVVSVIMVIFGGFRYITSGGDSGKITSAKNTIVYALVGLVIVALAQVIVLFVYGKL